VGRLWNGTERGCGALVNDSDSGVWGVRGMVLTGECGALVEWY
jgi:hypothetical protein